MKAETPNLSETDKSTITKDVKTSHHATRYLITGICITLFNFILFSIIANIFIKSINLNWLSTLISTIITTIVAFIAHSKITWREREVTKHSIIRFFIWNALLAIAIQPALVQIFSLITPLYNFAFNITTSINLPFDYDFVLNTGAFALASIVIMILNFLFYDKFVFGKHRVAKK